MKAVGQSRAPTSTPGEVCRSLPVTSLEGEGCGAGVSGVTSTLSGLEASCGPALALSVAAESRAPALSAPPPRGAPLHAPPRRPQCGAAEPPTGACRLPPPASMGEGPGYSMSFWAR